MADASNELRRGWRNLLAAAIGIGLGIAAYTPISSLFLTALMKEFGWSKVAAAGALVALPISAVALPVAGTLIDRFGVRLVSGLSGAGAVGGYLWLSRMGGGVREYYIGLLALYILGCATGPVAYTRLIAAQFEQCRGLALAIAQFGIAFIAILMPPIIGTIISANGWRVGFLFFAGATALGAVVAQILMQPAKAVAKSGGAGATVGQALSSGAFWCLGLAILAISTAAFGIVAQFQPILADRHFAIGEITFLLSLLAFSVMVSRLVVGRVLDLSHPERWAGAVMLIPAAGAALLWAGSGGLGLVALAVLLLGFSIGAELDLMSFFCARLFGIRHYAAIYGLLSIFFYGGIAAGSVTYGAIRSRTGEFSGALGASVALLVVAASLFLLLSRWRPGRSAAFTETQDA